MYGALTGFMVFLMALKFFTSSRKKMSHYTPVTEVDKEGPFHHVKSMADTIKNGIKQYTYPMLDKFGLKINVIYLNDPDRVP